MRLTLSTEEWEISLSWKRALFSKIGIKYPLIILAHPQIFSELIGFLFWGIAELPFWFEENPSSTSWISLWHNNLIFNAIFSKVDAVNDNIIV